MGGNHNDHLRQFTFLSALSDADLQALGSTLTERTLDTDQMLFEKGTAGDSMGLLVRGRLRVTVGTGNLEKEVAAIYPGEVVGEMACIDPTPRSADVVATEPSVVLELNRTMLQALQQNAPSIAVAIQGGIVSLLAQRIRNTNALVEQRIEMGQTMNTRKEAPKTTDESTTPPSDRVDLRSLDCLQGFSNEELKMLLQEAPPHSYSPDQVLFREGDPGDSCAILGTGSLEVIRRIAGQDRVLAVLRPGTMVGQMALIDNTLRSATIRVREKAIMLCLKRTAFESLLAQNDSMAIRFQHHIAVAGARQLRLANAKLALFTEKIISSPAGSNPTPKETDDSEDQFFWGYLQTALNEWDLSVTDLDEMEISRPDGVMSAEELKARQKAQQMP